MFRNQKGKSGKISWQTRTEVFPYGDTFCSFEFITPDNTITSVFFKKKKGEKTFSYDETLSLQRWNRKK